MQPIIFAFFGGAGDLEWRKLVPALFDLSLDRSLPRAFSIIAVDRVDLDDSRLRRRLHDGVKRFSRRGTVKSKDWNTFARHLRYIRGDFEKLRT
jgi:glucose-6-phosphate 1-dehydrogenase